MIEIILLWILNKAQAPWYFTVLLCLHIVWKYLPITLSFLASVVKRLEEKKL